MELSALLRQNSNSAVGGRMKGMVGLESAEEDARVDKHGLNAVWIDAFSADGLIA